MRYKEAIAEADKLRPNVQEETEKVKWLLALESEIAEMMGLEKGNETAEEDPEGPSLLLPAPKDRVYVLYLAAMIDYYNEEYELYANDYALYNAEMAGVQAWWRRHNLKGSKGNWRAF